jgi:hypothetical protein
MELPCRDLRRTKIATLVIRHLHLFDNFVKKQCIDNQYVSLRSTCSVRKNGTVPEDKVSLASEPVIL